MLKSFEQLLPLDMSSAKALKAVQSESALSADVFFVAFSFTESKVKLFVKTILLILLHKSSNSLIEGQTSI